MSSARGSAAERDRLRVPRLVIVHWIMGASLGLCCAGLLLAFDAAGLRSLLLRSDLMAEGLALLFGGFAITFGGVVAATAVMNLGHGERQDGATGGTRLPAEAAPGSLRPAVVRGRPGR